MFNFFSKKRIITDINWLGVDMHSHILPGIDDGSPNLEVSLQLVKALEELGYEKIIASPHIFKELYPNTPATIGFAKDTLLDAMGQQGIRMKLEAGAEYMLDHDFNIDGDLCLLNEDHILVEMSYLSENPNISQSVFDLQIKGYRPILAHPERYIYYFKDWSVLKSLKDKGCLLQLNLLSIFGYYGKDVKQAAEVLLKEKMYDLAGTDLHHDKHLYHLTAAIKSGRMYETLGQYPFKNRELFGD